MDEARVVKFCTQVNYIRDVRAENRLWLWSRDPSDPFLVPTLSNGMFHTLCLEKNETTEHVSVTLTILDQIK